MSSQAQIVEEFMEANGLDHGRRWALREPLVERLGQHAYVATVGEKSLLALDGARVTLYGIEPIHDGAAYTVVVRQLGELRRATVTTKLEMRGDELRPAGYTITHPALPDGEIHLTKFDLRNKAEAGSVAAAIEPFLSPDS